MDSSEQAHAKALLAVVERQRNAALNRAANLEAQVDTLQTRILDLESEIERLNGVDQSD